MDRKEAKTALDNLIKISRVHLYKPIQIAEILYHKRVVEPNLDLLNKEAYRIESKKWRDKITIELLGTKCTSSTKFQDDIFSDTAIPPETLVVLSQENDSTDGAVEAYIYKQFKKRHNQLSDALVYCTNNNCDNFNVETFINAFREQAGLKRSMDKIYEIVVYALFSTIINELELTVEVTVNENKLDLIKEFEDFTKSVLCIDFSKPVNSQQARVFRVGATNAADRGLDMYANWGPAIQIKHLALDASLAEDITDSVSSDKVVIVCKTADKKIIESLLNQIGWKSKIQSIITEDELIGWYEKALRGKYAVQMGEKLLEALIDEIIEEFPSLGEQENILNDRHYEKIKNEFWE